MRKDKPGASGWAGVFRTILAVAAAGFLGMYVVIALLRMGYPFELEWLEGGSLDQVRRILAGGKLYVEPTMRFTPFVYPPLYFYVSAAVAAVLGTSFESLRLVSFFASLGVFWILFRFVRDETGDRWAGLLAAGLFAATYRASGAWLDIGRIDTLFLFLLLAGLYLVRFRPKPGPYAAAGVLVGLAFLTKQTTLMIAAPAAFYTLLAQRRACVFFLGAALLVGLGGTAVLDYVHDGWYRFYTYQTLKTHAIVPEMYVGFWTKDVLRPLAFALVGSLFYLVSMARTDWRVFAFYILFAAGMIAGSWVQRLNFGGYDNARLPAYAALAVLGVLGMDRVGRLIAGKTVRRRGAWSALVTVAVTIQLAMLWYDPRAQVPTRADRAAGEELVALIRSIHGDVLLPSHPYLLAAAGKPPFAHESALADLAGRYGGTTAELGEKVLADLAQAIIGKQFGAIVLDDRMFMPEIVDSSYLPSHRAISSDDAFWPVTGLRARPEMVYVRREESPDTK